MAVGGKGRRGHVFVFFRLQFESRVTLTAFNRERSTLHDRSACYLL